MATQVSIDRSSLGLADLLIDTTPRTDFWLPEDGIGAPGYSHRRSYATAAYVHGGLQTAAVLEQSTLPLSIYVGGDTTAQLRNRVEALVAALRQFYFTTTVTVDDYAETWGCDCADIGPATYVPGEVTAHIQRREVTIPVYPIAGAL
jgi:hypothetical protein